jgi:hypothetical protein
MILPRDKDDFVKSFHYNETTNIVDFLDTYGVVVIHDILSLEEINHSIDEIWNHDELTSRGVSRYTQDTWGRCWPCDGKIEKKGWINSCDDLLYPVSWKNRFNSKLIDTFETIWKKKRSDNVDLRVKTDRYGVMRPILKKEWQTDDGWLHTDQNPTTEKDFIRFQGMITLSESTKNSGGFLCIPKFHKEWDKYCEQYHPDEHVCPFTTSNDIRAEKITTRPGSLIIWDSRLPHANYPNQSKTEFRYVQYITYYPQEYDSEKMKRNKREDAEHIFQILIKKGLELKKRELQYICGK